MCGFLIGSVEFGSTFRQPQKFCWKNYKCTGCMYDIWCRPTTVWIFDDAVTISNSDVEPVNAHQGQERCHIPIHSNSLHQN